MRLNYIYMILVSLTSCNSEDISFGDSSGKPDSDLKLAELYENGRYDWPPSMFKDNVQQDVWGNSVIGKRFHEWPNVLPWAKGGKPPRRSLLRKKRRNAQDGSGLVDLDPQTLIDRHKVVAPKVKTVNRLWPNYLY